MYVYICACVCVRVIHTYRNFVGRLTVNGFMAVEKKTCVALSAFAKRISKVLTPAAPMFLSFAGFWSLNSTAITHNVC